MGEADGKHKDTACPTAVKGFPCAYHDDGNKCFYNHEESVVRKAKETPEVKPKAKAKGKERGKGKGVSKGMTAEEKKLVPCRQFQTADGCRFGDTC